MIGDDRSIQRAIPSQDHKGVEGCAGVGREGDASLDAQEIARVAGTISYKRAARLRVIGDDCSIQGPYRARTVRAWKATQELTVAAR